MLERGAQQNSVEAEHRISANPVCLVHLDVRQRLSLGPTGIAAPDLHC